MICVFGEALLEYHTKGGSGLRYGGDTLNTAFHLVRSGLHVAYVTAIGQDKISEELLSDWKRAGIDTRFVFRHPYKNVGIYATHLSPNGERAFVYWRNQSAAREMFEMPGIDAAIEEARSCNLLYFSLVSLAVVSFAGRARLLSLARDLKEAGRAVAYDSNFRPVLWRSRQEAAKTSRQAVSVSTIGLPTNADERSLFCAELSEPQIAERWKGWGCSEVVVKAGEKGAFWSRSKCEGEWFAALPTTVIDTSGAGDAFNGGFLSAWSEGLRGPVAVGRGQKLASETLQHFGAIRL